jgi:hypothetical protein
MHALINFLTGATHNEMGAHLMFEANRRIFLRSFEMGAGAPAAMQTFAAGGDGHAAGYDASSASEHRRIRRENIFTRIIEALHFSRRLEAARVLRRHHDLIVNDSQGQLKKCPTAIR